MRDVVLTCARWCDRITTLVCAAALALLVGTVLAVVLLRFGFDMGFIKLQNLAGYAFAVLLILSLPYCLARGGHVRVDVLSEQLPPAYLRRADLVALVCFLMPVFGLMIWAFLPDLRYSWAIREGAIETGGLGGVYLVKSTVALSGALMIVQGIAAVLRPDPAGAADPS
ncbi:MAG: TRAP transporter small permease subunit [Paracoccaceae bacterium]|uniref:TRAP transporter small permease subunit n=1 Tax=Seohaeicola saemankumensis TaxID=481181 RepID=UPI001E434EB6|nr:TRAP transporter small permease subunit [Seohaeicola saemankumensis]MCD1626242.1 TRAP transporter small permease subunit [Seohaeicola saemankumensis]